MAARIAASLLVCAAALAAADGLGTEAYTWDELQAGKDIHEGIYNSLAGGEFDEWRLGITLSPTIDRIQVKGDVNGAPYPGPAGTETDRAYSVRDLGRGLSLTWVLGDFDRSDQGWYYGLGLDYSSRTYHILYAVGTESERLTAHLLGASFEYGYMWYLDPHWRLELGARVAGGPMWNQMDMVEMTSGFSDTPFAQGVWIEGGGRAAIAWHPTGTKAWNIGLGMDYRHGYGQVFHDVEGPLGDMRTEVRMWWYGFGYSLFYGHRF